MFESFSTRPKATAKKFYQLKFAGDEFYRAFGRCLQTLFIFKYLICIIYIVW